MMAKLLSHPLVSNRVFYPRRTTAEPTQYITSGDVRLACYRATPYSGAGTIVHFHGNGELAADYLGQLSDLFLSSGLNVCFVDYRGYGFSEGLPDLLTQIDDNETILTSLDVPLEHMIVVGRSLGSVFAIDVVSRLPAIGGLVLESGIADVYEDWELETVIERIGVDADGLQREINQYFDLRTKLANFSGHLLVLHTKNDRHVPVSHAERLFAWSGTKHKEFVAFPVGDHNSIMHFNSVAYVKHLRALATSASIPTA